jgi:hypothetical protein
VDLKIKIYVVGERIKFSKIAKYKNIAMSNLRSISN